MTEWKEKYGDILGIYNGRKRVVVISGLHILRKIFSEDAASGRVHENLIREKNSAIPIGIGLLFSQGDLWKTHRRFALSTLRDLGMGTNWMEDTIIAEVEGICDVLRNANGKPFNPKIRLTNSVSNIICALMFGKTFSLADPKFSRLTDLVAENAAIFKQDFVASAAPFLLWFPNVVRTKIFKARRNLTGWAEFMTEMINEHLASPWQLSKAPDYVYAYQ
ncbi:putative Cytochrome P450 2H2 [Hypsibius exemplaris]|uniref:Cytochrome P450 2H2 n=1 Tax=Hypsibius exemplaris TaxID=2072580 RepID=A0A9X6RMN5_HYPEX|nr:putative Cytochrome P450 2H2 [Hypsibius exemplaris]